MKITLTLISAFLITFVAKAQHLSFIKEPDKINKTFNVDSLFNRINTAERTHLYTTDLYARPLQQNDFVYFPFKTTLNGQYTEPLQGNKIYSLLDMQAAYTEKPAIYQQQIKLPGKLSFRGAIELIPCNDLDYFIPDVIARNY